MRIEAQSKLGYYPTPEKVVYLIKKHLRIPDKEFTALDPCCGTGRALEILTTGSKAKTYGVEIDGVRAKEANEVLDKVENEAIESMAITPGSFSLLYLNPPYDADETGERKEYLFLKLTTTYLAPRGILIYIIPNRYIRNVFDCLKANYENIKIYAFPKEEYRIFNQVVIFGVKRKEPVYDVYSSSDYYNYYSDRKLGEGSCEYVIPSMRSEKVKVFKSARNLEELNRALKKSDVWERFKSLTRYDRALNTRPILPLRKGHIGLLLAGGYLDGEVAGHVAKGMVIEEKIVDTSGDTIKERTNLKVSIKILSKNGEIKVLS